MALAQVERVRTLLARIDPFLTVEVVPVTTRADQWAGDLAKLGGKGHFVRQLDRMLLDGEVDAVAHCLKDMESDRGFPEGITVAAFLEREDSRDVLVQPGKPTVNLSAPVMDTDPLAALPHGAHVGTSAVRRRAQLHAARPDLVLLAARGNVNSRLARLAEGEWDALVLAASGLHRIGRTDAATGVLPPEQFMPAAGAGIIALARRISDQVTGEVLRRLDHAATRAAALAERACLQTLHGHCGSPIAAHARIDRGRLVLTAAVYAADGTKFVTSHGIGSPLDPSTLGEDIGTDLLEQGAADLIAAAANYSPQVSEPAANGTAGTPLHGLV